MSSVEVAANHSLNCVYKSINEGKPVRALGHLLIVLNLEPNLKAELRSVVVSLLSLLSRSLAAEERYDDLLKCYEQVSSVYDDSAVVLNNIGSQLYRFSHPKAARHYFQLACNIDADYLPSFRNLQNINNSLVERWHFRMLNDSKRNEAFKLAIYKRVSQNASTVIDIGTGTGLLSLYANQAGAKYICACDYSSVMTSIAKKVFQTNLSSYSTVEVINKLSTDMTIPEDLPSKCSLVVTETMDSGLLGEHLLRTLNHAWNHLVLPKSSTEQSRIIPSGATLFATPIESIKIARKNKILAQKRIISTSMNFDPLNWFGLNVRAIKQEPYDTENLFTASHCRYLSEPVRVFTFNFNDSNEIERRLNDSETREFEIDCQADGYLDAIAVWFEANLDDELTITTSPLEPDHCTSWHHAIFPCDGEEVRAGNKIRLTFQCNYGILSARVKGSDVQSKLIHLDECAIKFINSASYLSDLHLSISRILSTKPSFSKIVDTSVFPYEGLLLSKHSNFRLLAINDIPSAIFNEIVDANGIKSHLVKHMQISNVELDDEEPLEEKYDFIILNVIGSSGEMSQESLEKSACFIRKFLKPEGIIVPSKIEIWGQLVDSKQLVDESRVTNPDLNDNTILGHLINEYQVSTHLDVSIEDLNFVPLTDKFLLASIPIHQIFHRDDLLLTEVKTFAKRRGRLNAILYWFESTLFDDVVQSTAASSDSSTNQIAEILPKDILVSENDALTVVCKYNYGVVKLQIDTIVAANVQI